MNRSPNYDELLKLAQSNLPNDSFKEFSVRRQAAFDLFRFLEERGDERFIQEARRNLIVSTVSAFEVYLKDLIVEYRGKWQPEGVSILTKDKITLYEAYILFNQYGLQLEKVIANYHSFQNIDTIQKVFNALTGTDIIKEISNVHLNDSGKTPTLVSMFPDWRKDFIDCLKLRNQIIHENTNQLNLPQAQTQFWYMAINYACFGINIYIVNHYLPSIK